ncbi:MAG TPA: metallophosphoesterase [Candidatus Angelobacter sp.]|nr:metallophosphoesterase [Candidatus Angelobacter sp.]
MRIAIISDIHGNLTALDAILADLRQQKPDLVLHGGDLAAVQGPLRLVRPSYVADDRPIAASVVARAAC